MPGARYMWQSVFRSGSTKRFTDWRLVDPLLAARGRVDDPLVVDVEGREVVLLQVGRDRLDVLQLAVEVLQVVDQVLVPEARALEVLHEEGIQDDELAGEVGFDEEVLVGRLDAGRGAHDVRDRRGGRDGEDIAVAHAVLRDLGRGRAPSPSRRRAAPRASTPRSCSSRSSVSCGSSPRSHLEPV